MVVAATKLVPAFLGGFICIYGLVSGFIKQRLYLSESLVAMVFGIIIGPKVSNALDPRDFVDTDNFTLEFSRYVIAIQVVVAGITLPRRYILQKWRTMSVLLGPVMIVMWLVSAGIIQVIFRLGFLESLLIASCAAPTDAILANSVMKGNYAETNVPKNVRDALSAESGINDGFGMLFLYFALYLLNSNYSTGYAIGRWFYWIWCYHMLLSIVIGIVVGYVARKLLRLAETHNLIDKESFLAFSIGLAIFIVGILQLIHSDDILCCFVAGHAFTWDDWFRQETKDAHFQEILDGLVNVAFFIYFGTIIPWHNFNNAVLMLTPWRLIVAAVMILLLRRMPIVVLLTRITPAFRNYRQSIFAGWFGPIGVGALFFAQTIHKEFKHEPEHFHYVSGDMVVPIVSFLVFSSVLVHGITVPLAHIGKVVRSRSRSISSVSIRNGIASRLSFVNSREPTGIHGVHIPMINRNSNSPLDLINAQSKRDSRTVFDLPITTDDQSPTVHNSKEPSPNASEKGGNNNDDEQPPLPSLELSRSITIDDKPKVSRDQMDIHYRINIFRRHHAHHQPLMSPQRRQTPSALSSPKYSHLQMPSPPIMPVRSQSVYEVGGEVPVADDDMKGVDRLVGEGLGISVRIADMYRSDITQGRDNDVDERSLVLGISTSSAAENPKNATETIAAVVAASKEEVVQQGYAYDGLLLNADNAIASLKTSRSATRETRLGAAEVFKARPPTSGILQTPLPIHSSAPPIMPMPIIEPETSGVTINTQNGIQSGISSGNGDGGGAPLRRQRTRTNSQLSTLPMRRIMRKNRRQRNVATDGSEQICQFIGNHKNPLGRLENGELVDYDDPNDHDREESFTDKNIDDRFIDYFRMDIGENIRRLTSKLSVFGRSKQPVDDEERNVGEASGGALV
ncbi:hypothetical protein LPJ66_001831 [Kickxella alabastrina]|uniref:Uncharacterized protein n=1 Tax=Kickxella alabastrina TaxID=61397 RepID=A0ACC1IS94_9FUNG|nr:hypothetical protein LPJ66_001831 [Kickxella alabastrina]